MLFMILSKFYIGSRIRSVIFRIARIPTYKLQMDGYDTDSSKINLINTFNLITDYFFVN